MKIITAYCLDWHIKNSDAFRDMLVDPLKNRLAIKLRAWDGEKLPEKPDKNETLIFCMLPPSEKILARADLKLIWLPMWDQAQGYTQEWWNALPKNLRVVAFSDVIYDKALKANLPVLRITYFKNPHDTDKVSWKKGPVVFYWNRTGMIGPDFIKNLCTAIKPYRFIFMPRIDPRIEDNKFYELPDKIGGTEVISIEPSDRATFLERTKDANILIAPRLTEGVGMTFLESMCRGGLVMAHNAPTMNEYIRHGQNGLLFSNSYYSNLERLSAKLRNTKLGPRNSAPFLVSEHQPWNKIAKMDLEKLGNKAYSDHVAGFRAWQKDIKKYEEFVLNW